MRPTHASNRRAVKGRGFTLVEVLVALVIVALGMGAALAALSSAADNAGRLRQRGFAQWIAFNQISTSRLGLQAPTEGTTEGTVENYANSNWKWQQVITQLDTPGIYRIEVKVREDTGSDANTTWLADVSGFRGTALAAASGELPNWNGTAPNSQRGNANGGQSSSSSSGSSSSSSGSSSSGSSQSSSSSSSSNSSSSSSSSSSPAPSGLPTSYQPSGVQPVHG